MSMKYPSDIGTSDIYITLTRYSNRGFKTQQLRNIDYSYKNVKTNPENIIALPVPNGLSDELNLSYQDITDSSLLESGAKNLLNKAPGADKAKAIASTLSGKGTTNQSLMSFGSVGVKSWTWTWTLIPENKTEANNIINIIKSLREGAMPYYESSNTFINFPDIYKIKFAGKTKPKLFRYLPSVITNVSANTGDFFQIYQDGNFPEINLSITFSEMVSRVRDIEKRLY